MYMDKETFKTVVENTPLVSVDLIVKKESKYLLGRRVNKPAKGYWFTLGGRVLKNERISDAIHRISDLELGTKIEKPLKFLGVFEHLYDDAIYDGVSTHYVNLGYEVETSTLEDLPDDQHSDYRWFDLEELMESKEVHDYVKDYFRQNKGTIPQEKGEK